jgi:FkbM family methyltransferase
MREWFKTAAKSVLGPRTYEWLRIKWTFRVAHPKYFNRIYDYLTEEVIRAAVKPDSMCVDVGCNEGFILRMMSEHAPLGAHLAFEPIPRLYEQVKAHFASTPVRVYNLALAEAPGRSTFWHVAASSGYSSLKPRSLPNPRWETERLEVAVETLDRMVKPDEHVTLVKIDVEGAELQVMRGGRETLRRCRPLVVFEWVAESAAAYGAAPEDPYRFLQRECGLRVSLLEDWLGGRAPLTLSAFRRHVRRGTCYFLGHS